MTDSATFQAAADVLATEFGDEVVLLNLQDGVYYGLESVGARIWAMLRSPTTVRAIYSVIVSEYEVEPERCDRDVRAILTALADSGLISVRPSP